ncbi:MAG: allophanate hydrolase [Pseudomonadota bacterium]
MPEVPSTCTALRAAYAEGLRATDMIEAVYARIAAVDDPGIFIHLRDRADLLAEAAALGPFDPGRPLWGVPFAVKDNIDFAGIETTAGCPAYAYMPAADAFVVARLRAAGALLIGKTNLDQFATGLVGMRTPYGAPRNACDPAFVPGGSSSGSAVAVSHGIVSFALGTDTAGSGRVPAALNNIVGLKPTLGALSASGVVPACRTLDTVSVFALTVEDAYAVFDAARGYDPADAYSKRWPRAPLAAMPPDLSIAVPDTASRMFFGDTVQQAAFERDLVALAGLGARISAIDFTPFYDVAQLLYEGPWVAERYTVIEDLLTRQPDAVHPVTAAIISQATEISAADVFRSIYRLAELKRRTEPLIEGHDLLCVPSIPTLYTTADLAADPVTPNSRLGTYTNFVNLLDLCGIAVPTAPRSDGRPSGVTLLAAAGRDAQVAALARQLETRAARRLGATEITKAAQESPPAAGGSEDRIEIAVCGAHMAGLPLNGQLTERGAIFMRSAQTAPHYRFYALSGGPPQRPGLLRTNEAGASVALEIWSLPKAALGGFVEGIPPPLGIGSIELADGAWVKGFLCEAAGIEGARDISDIGDWRLALKALG